MRTDGNRATPAQQEIGTFANPQLNVAWGFTQPYKLRLRMAAVGSSGNTLSYNGRVQFGVITDHEMIADPRGAPGACGPELERLVPLVLLGSGAV